MLCDSRSVWCGYRSFSIVVGDDVAVLLVSVAGGMCFLVSSSSQATRPVLRVHIPKINKEINKERETTCTSCQTTKETKHTHTHTHTCWSLPCQNKASHHCEKNHKEYVHADPPHSILVVKTKQPVVQLINQWSLINFLLFELY